MWNKSTEHPALYTPTSYEQSGSYQVLCKDKDGDYFIAKLVGGYPDDEDVAPKWVTCCSERWVVRREFVWKYITGED